MEEKIKAKEEELRGFLQADGGDMEVVSITGTDVKLRLQGACGCCPHATMTIKQGIERILREQRGGGGAGGEEGQHEGHGRELRQEEEETPHRFAEDDQDGAGTAFVVQG